MTITEKKEALLSELSAIANPQERFAFVVSCGRNAPGLPEELKIDVNRVEGCLAKLWFIAEKRDGKCFFRCDSDSAIVKGIASVLCNFYNDQTSDEVLCTDPSFLESVGITQHLTPNRRNSLTKIWEKIRRFAENNRE